MKRASKHYRSGGARVEVGSINLDGKTFSNLGSVIDHKAGIVIGYPKTEDGVTYLTTWDGQKIARLHTIARHKDRRGVFSDERVAYRAVLDGHPYHATGGGEGMLLRMRPSRGLSVGEYRHLTKNRYRPGK